MKWLRGVLARLLRAVGLARQVFHVDDGAFVRVRATALDGLNRQPVAGVSISIERPALGRERGPRSSAAGETDAAGRLDAEVLVRWWHFTSDPTAIVRAPGMTAVLTRSGFSDARISFSIESLPRVGDAWELDLGEVALTP